MDNKVETLIEFYNNNKNDLIDFYKKTTDLNVLESTLNNINNSNVELSAIKELKNIIDNRINELKSKSLEDAFNELKQNNIYLKDFNLVETTKDINNKDYYGFKNNTTYLKVNIDDNNKMFEIENSNIDKVKYILEQEKDSNLNTKDLIEKLLPYLNELEQIEMDYKTNLNKETLIEELNNIDDMDIKQVFLRDINDVLKERIKINYYMNDNGLLNEKLNYSLNSNGERIYYIGNQIIKFDNEKNMRILDDNNKFVEQEKDKEIQSKEFEVYSKSNENNDTINVPTSLEELDTEFYINAIKYSFNKIYTSENLNNYETKLVEVFIALCINTNENDIPLSLYEIYNTYLNYVNETNDYYNSYIEEMLKDKKIENIKQNNINNKQKQLILDKNGTVDIILILCGIILIVIIILYLLLVK